MNVLPVGWDAALVEVTGVAQARAVYAALLPLKEAGRLVELVPAGRWRSR